MVLVLVVGLVVVVESRSDTLLPVKFFPYIAAGFKADLAVCQCIVKASDTDDFSLAWASQIAQCSFLELQVQLWVMRSLLVVRPWLPVAGGVQS